MKHSANEEHRKKIRKKKKVHFIIPVELFAVAIIV